MMRVLTVASWYPSEDAPTAGIFIQQQVRALNAVVDPAVLHVSVGGSGVDPYLELEDGVPVVRAAVAGSGIADRYFGYRRAGRDAADMLVAQWGTPDIVHVHALWPAALIGRDIARRLGVPYVVTEHSEEYAPGSTRRLVRTPGMVPLVLRPLARGAARTIAVSRHLADRLQALGLSVSVTVVPNVVPMAHPAPFPVSAPRVLAHVSLMGPAKDLPTLLQAVHLLHGRRRDFLLRLVGDGECRKGAEDLAAELNLGGIVEFIGRLSEEGVRETLAGAVCTVVSSAHETFSVSAAESLMCGRPVVSTRCGGPEEYLTPQVSRLVDTGDAVALADGLDWMLDHYLEFDPQALHAYACERFAPQIVAEQILDVYREVLGD